jgi:hypothetical protein
MLETIGCLLRKAESTSEHEADALIQAAQRLATMYAIDIEVARQWVPEHERKGTLIQKVVHLGEAGKKGLHTYVELYCAIAYVNDVECTIGHYNNFATAYGFPQDIEVTETLYVSLLCQMVEASSAYLRTGAHKVCTCQPPCPSRCY